MTMSDHTTQDAVTSLSSMRAVTAIDYPESVCQDATERVRVLLSVCRESRLV